MKESIKNVVSEIEKLKSKWEYKKAILKLEEAISSNKDNYMLYEELADVYIFLWEFKKAEKAVDYSLSLFKNSATWNYLKGFILLWKNKYAQAVAYLEKSNSLASNNAEVLRNLGWAYHMNGNSQKWLFILKRALNISPWDKLIMQDLAMVLIWIWEVSQWNKILDELKKAK